MGAVIIPVMTAMVLGSTFDLRRYQRTTGGELFKPDVLKGNTMIINRSFTKSSYMLVENSVQARSFLDVGGDLSLRIKSGNLKVEGSGTYLLDKENRQKFVELLVRVQHETVTETIPSHLPTSTEWMSVKNLGTHFVRSITYGGELVASLRLTARNLEERELIKAAVSTNLQLVGSFDVNATGNFDKLRQDLSGMYNAEIKLMSTTLPTSPPQDIIDLMKFVESYPEQISKINNGLGNPIKLELYPLSSLKTDYSNYLPNNALANLLDDVDIKFDDIRTTLNEFNDWNRRRDSTKDTEEIEEKLGNFYEIISKAQKIFILAISKLDVSSTGYISQFDEAFEHYGTGSDNTPHRFSRWFWKLRHEITNEPIVWKQIPGSGVVFVNWGSKECPKTPGIKLLYAGYASGSLATAWNGARDYLCLPENNPKLITATVREQTPIYEQLIASRSLQNADEMKYIACGTCFVPDKINTHTFIAMTTCPEGWTLQYSGHLMADSYSAIDRSFMCLNKDANGTDTSFQDSSYIGKLNAVWMNCDKCNGEKVVPCIMCIK